MSDDPDLEEIKRHLLVLTKQKLVLPTCPSCGIPVDLDEDTPEAECASCHKIITADNALWYAKENYPSA